MTEKILRFRWLIIAVMVLAFAPKTVQAQTTVTLEPPSSGNGSQNNPYQIASKENLYWFANEVNNNGKTTICAVLAADIPVNENVLDADGNLNSGNTVFYEWTPIGNSAYTPYAGIFDGQGHAIRGLYFNKEKNQSDAWYIGLFGYSSGTVKNVGVEDSYFNVPGGNLYIGGVCGNNVLGTIKNCYNTGTISGRNYVGGVCGRITEGTITNCYNTGTIYGTGDYTMVGGVCGYSCNSSYSNTEITNCYNSGMVSAGNHSYVNVGGVCGNNENTITNCYYLKDENNPKYPTKGIGDNSDAAGSVEGKTIEYFTNGSVAWLLNGNTTDDSTTPEKTLPWLQNFSENGGDKYPVLKANTSNNVCPIVAKNGDDGYKNGEEHSYDNVTFADFPDAGTINLYSHVCDHCKGAAKDDKKKIKGLNCKNNDIIITQEEDNVWKTEASITLGDNPATNWYNAPEEFTTAGGVSYTRNMSGNRWATICLPYQITVGNYTNKCKFYELKSVETDKITLTELTENIEAGTPVFIKRNSESVTEISFEESDVKMIQTPKEQTANGNRLVGAFNTVKLTMDDNSNCLFLKKDNMWSVTQANKTMTVKPFRAYIVPATSNGAPQRSIAVDGEATAISDALDTLNDANTEYYDMSGRRINALQKGVNIIRSGNKTRKVIIK